jgi:hypothetical protein
MVQQSPIHFLQLATHFYWNENFDFTFMDILKDNWDSQLDYVVLLFNISYNTNIIFKKLKNVFNSYNYFLNNTSIPINKILYNTFTSISLTRILKTPKIQMKHSHLIVELNVIQKEKFIF